MHTCIHTYMHTYTSPAEQSAIDAPSNQTTRVTHTNHQRATHTNHQTKQTGRCSQLWALLLWKNKFRGQIPDSFGKLTNIQVKPLCVRTCVHACVCMFSSNTNMELSVAWLCPLLQCFYLNNMYDYYYYYPAGRSCYSFLSA